MTDDPKPDEPVKAADPEPDTRSTAPIVITQSGSGYRPLNAAIRHTVVRKRR